MRDLKFSKVLGKFAVLVLLTGICFVAGSRRVQAQEATYNVTGVTFTDGEVLNGYFDYNPTGTFMSSYNITTSGGTFAPATYIYSGPGYSTGNPWGFDFSGTDTSPLNIATLALSFYPTSVTSTGPQNVTAGVLGAPGSWTGSAEQFQEYSNKGPYQDLAIESNQVVNAGALQTNKLSTPEPSEVLILCIGLLGTLSLAAIGRKKSILHVA